MADLSADLLKRNMLSAAADYYVQLGMYSEAEAASRRALALGPEGGEAEVFSVHARGLMHQGRYDEAIATIDDGLRIGPEDFGLHAWRIVIDLLQEDHASARRSTEELLQSGSKHKIVYHLMAYALAGEGHWDEAVSYARRALDMDPGRRSHTLLAWLLIAGDVDIDLGVELAEKARTIAPPLLDRAELFPFVPSPEHALGLAHLERGNHTRAAALLERAADLRPDRGSIREHLARARRGS